MGTKRKREDEVKWVVLDDFPNYEFSSEGVLRNIASDTEVAKCGDRDGYRLRKAGSRKQYCLATKKLLAKYFPPKSLEGEIWKSDPEFAYDASSKGRIRRRETMHLLKFQKTKDDYLTASLSRKLPNQTKQVTTVKVHIFIGKLFLGPQPSPRHTVDHINFDRGDNRIENLKWATPEEQMQAVIARGRRDSHVQPVAQLDDEGKVLNTYPSIAAAAQELEIDFELIRTALRNKVKHFAAGYYWKRLDKREFDARAAYGVTAEEEDKEEWKTNEDNPGYEFSNLGRARNSKTGRMLKPQVESESMKTRILDRNGKRVNVFIHLMIAKVWLSPPSYLRTYPSGTH